MNSQSEIIFQAYGIRSPGWKVETYWWECSVCGRKGVSYSWPQPHLVEYARKHHVCSRTRREWEKRMYLLDPDANPYKEEK